MYLFPVTYFICIFLFPPCAFFHRTILVVVAFVFFCYSRFMEFFEWLTLDLWMSAHLSISNEILFTLCMRTTQWPLFSFFPVCRPQFLFEKLKINLDCQSYHSDACPLICDFFVLLFSVASFFRALIASLSRSTIVHNLWVSFTVISMTIFYLFAVT